MIRRELLIIAINPLIDRVNVDFNGTDAEFLAAALALAIHQDERLRDIIFTALKIECSL